MTEVRRREGKIIGLNDETKEGREKGKDGWGREKEGGRIRDCRLKYGWLEMIIL